MFNKNSLKELSIWVTIAAGMLAAALVSYQRTPEKWLFLIGFFSGLICGTLSVLFFELRKATKARRIFTFLAALFSPLGYVAVLIVSRDLAAGYFLGSAINLSFASGITAFTHSLRRTASLTRYGWQEAKARSRILAAAYEMDDEAFEVLRMTLKPEALERALHKIDETIGRRGPVADLWVVKGNILDLLGQHAVALECYQEALRIDSDNLLARFDRADYFRWIGDYEAARSRYVDFLDYIQQTRSFSSRAIDRILEDLEAFAAFRGDSLLMAMVDGLRADLPWPSSPSVST